MTGIDAIRIGARYIEIVDEVIEQLAAQIEKWGVQEHPDGTANSTLNRAYAVGAQEACEEARSRGQLTWRHILTEEVMEAQAEDADSWHLRYELIQVAAVAIAWVENLDRRRL